MEFYQNFLTLFLFRCGIKSTDLVTQDNQYFEDDFKALCFDISSELISKIFVSKGHIEEKFGKLPDYKKALKYLSEIGIIRGDINY